MPIRPARSPLLFLSGGGAGSIYSAANRKGHSLMSKHRGTQLVDFGPQGWPNYRWHVEFEVNHWGIARRVTVHAEFTKDGVVSSGAVAYELQVDDDLNLVLEALTVMAATACHQERLFDAAWRPRQVPRSEIFYC